MFAMKTSMGEEYICRDKRVQSEAIKSDNLIDKRYYLMIPIAK